MPWRNRRFGIEFEAQTGRSSTDSISREASSLEFTHPALSSAQHYSYGFSEWSFGYDGDGIEVRSPILTENSWGEVFSMLRFLRSRGCRYGEGSGMHVHLDMSTRTWEQKLRTLVGWMSLENALFALLAPYRASSHWCPWTSTRVTRNVNFVHLLRYALEGRPLPVRVQGRWSGFQISTPAAAADELLLDTNRCAFGPNDGLPTFECRAHHCSLNSSDTLSWVTLLRVMADHWENDETPLETYRRLAPRTLEQKFSHLQDTIAPHLPASLASIVLPNLNNRMETWGRHNSVVVNSPVHPL